MPRLISVITPCLNEVGNVERCRARVREVFAEKLGEYDHEHIFADNGSTDGTRDILRQMAMEDLNVRVILNSRNFGAEASMFNALTRARGDAVMVMIPADMQDPPELIPEFVARWEEGFKVIYGIRRSRDEHPMMKVLRDAFYRAVSALSTISIPRHVGEYQLIDRVVADALRGFKERRPYLRGMIASCGFQSVGIDYHVQNRTSGRSTNNLYRLIDQGLNGLISFSTLPLRLIMFAGMIVSLASLLYAVATILMSLFLSETAPPGIPTLIVALFFFGGVQLFFLGVLGEYVLAIHTQVRQRPLVIEEEVLNFDFGNDQNLANTSREG